MINWESIQYDIEKARKDFENLEIEAVAVKPIEPKFELEKIREQLVAARDEIFEIKGYDYANKLDYQFDLLFGLKLFQILSEEVGFTNRVATNEDVWRYLSVQVIPDIVHARWQKNADHFYKLPRRVWLKQLWWYINLAWTGSEEETYAILKDNTTDTILQLVERPGIGYYTDTYRELMLQYVNYPDPSRNIFRRVLKLNTARLLTTVPELVDGGVQGYVKSLFETVKG